MPSVSRRHRCSTSRRHSMPALVVSCCPGCSMSSLGALMMALGISRCVGCSQSFSEGLAAMLATSVVVGGQWWKRKRERQERATTKVVACFRDTPGLSSPNPPFPRVLFLDAQPGPPTRWLGVSPTCIPSSSAIQTAHIPLQRGGARVG